MFGHKTEAEGKVIAVEKVREGFFGDIMGGEKPETWKFVVELCPEGTEPWRDEVEYKFPHVPPYRVPEVGEMVRVEYEENKPGTVRLLIKGDGRYDGDLREAAAEEKQHEKKQAQKGAERAAFDAALKEKPRGL